MTGAHRPRKRFGQNFLVCPDAIERILLAVAPRPGELMVEIGPGQGAITRGLAASGARLHAIELDRDLVPRLRRRFADCPNVTIHQADALDFDYGSLGENLRIVGNLPYNISTPLLFRLLKADTTLLDLHLMLQAEVVDRIVARPRSKAYGRLTIMLSRRLSAERLFDFPPEAFRPAPRVRSTFLRLLPRGQELAVADEALFAQLVTQAFAQRRKTLRNALKGLAGSAELASAGLPPAARAEEIGVEAWVALANRLAKRDRMSASESKQEP